MSYDRFGIARMSLLGDSPGIALQIYGNGFAYAIS